VVSPASDTYEPGEDITLTFTAKKKMPKGLTFFIAGQAVEATNNNGVSVKVTIPAGLP
jgi:hypothetical protein